MGYGIQLLMLLLAMFPQHHRKIFTPAMLSVTQTNGGSAVPSTAKVTVALTNVAAGDEIIVHCVVFNTRTCAVSDDKTQSYTQDSLVNGSTNDVYTWHFSNSASGALNVTCTDSITFSDMACFVLQLHAALTSGSFDVQATGTYSATTTPASATTATTNAANELVTSCFGISSGSKTFTAGTGYTLFINGSQGTTNRSAAAEYKIVSSTGTQQATGTLSGSAGGASVIDTYR